MKQLTEKEKRIVNQEVIDIIGFHAKVLGLRLTSELSKFGMQLFIEGAKYVRNKTKLSTNTEI